MMINELNNALKSIDDWTIRETNVEQDSQFYFGEGIRSGSSSKIELNIYDRHEGPKGNQVIGTASKIIIPGADISAKIRDGQYAASLVHNPDFSLPQPSAEGYPEMKLVADVKPNDLSLTDLANDTIIPIFNVSGIRLAELELFNQLANTHLITSTGIDASYIRSEFQLWVTMIVNQGGQEIERKFDTTLLDPMSFDFQRDIGYEIRDALDSLGAKSAPAYEGPVVLSGKALSELMAPLLDLHPFISHTTGHRVYTNASIAELGKSILKADVVGDPLMLYANAIQNMAVGSLPFDALGVPSRRTQILDNGVVKNLTAPARYAQYLGIPATGVIGNIELGSGSKTPEELLKTGETVYEIEQFSSVTTNPSGSCKLEVRMGKIHHPNGTVTPFKGGFFITDLRESFANVYYSNDKIIDGKYIGPSAMRFEQSQVTTLD